jgi:hypothetical protein
MADESAPLPPSCLLRATYRTSFSCWLSKAPYDTELPTDMWQQARYEARAAFHMLATYVPVRRLQPTR